MTPIARILVSLAIAAAVAAGYNFATSGAMPSPLLFAAFAIVAVLSTLLPSAGDTTTARPAEDRPAGKKRSKPAEKPAAPASGPREQGQVKWFNASKGFGFIIREDGEEIFVHFRSIRGEGRRSLRDGQSVSFVVTESDKGPQAEDVEGL